MTVRATVAHLPWVTRVAERDDPWDPRFGRHRLSALLLALPGVICGADTWVDMVLFGQRQRRGRETWRDLPYGMPLPDTCGRVLAVREAEPWATCFLRWVPFARLRGDRIAAATRDFLACRPPCTRMRLGAVRGHGGIANARHGTLDMALREKPRADRQVDHHRAVLRRWG